MEFNIRNKAIIPPLNPESIVKGKVHAGKQHKKDNDAIRSQVANHDLMLKFANGPGPTVIGIGDFTDASVEMAAAITAAYSDAEEGQTAPIKISINGEERILVSRSPGKGEFKSYML